MSKTGSTKNKILNLIATSNKTLSEISEELGLAPSTVSQHLQELKQMGAINEVENEHIKKWKYYSLNPNFDYAGSGMDGSVVAKIRNRTPSTVFFYAAIGLGIVAVLGYILLSYSTVPQSQAVSNTTISGSTSNPTYTPISLTDPPNVPNGTSALVVAYSSVSAHVIGTNSSGWISSNTTGKVDLLSLVNVSQVIAALSLPKNATVDKARFNITNATITINGTSYNVIVPGGQINSQVSGKEKLNSSSGLLLDLSPTIVAIYSNNSTVFVMVPSVKAVVVSNANISTSYKNITKHIGQRAPLTGNDTKALYMAHTNISITGASLQTVNGTVDLQITVKNNGNNTAYLNQVVLVGNQVPVLTYNGSCNTPPQNGTPVPSWCRLVIGTNINTSIIANGNIVSKIGKMAIPLGGNGVSGSGSIVENTSTSANVPINPIPTVTAIDSKINASANVLSKIESGRNTTFVTTLINSNGGGRFKGIPNITVVLPHSNFSSGIIGNSNITINDTAFYHLVAPMPYANQGKTPTINDNAGIVSSISFYRGLNFNVEQNGTLSLQNNLYPVLPLITAQTTGYMLKPGQSVNLTFTGDILLPGDFRISLPAGAHYKVAVSGVFGVQATTNVTST